jgi:arginine/lysine/ornithine decarboxylase
MLTVTLTSYLQQDVLSCHSCLIAENVHKYCMYASMLHALYADGMYCQPPVLSTAGMIAEVQTKTLSHRHLWLSMPCLAHYCCFVFIATKWVALWGAISVFMYV